jgi:hypothetical protein
VLVLGKLLRRILMFVSEWNPLGLLMASYKHYTIQKMLARDHTLAYFALRLFVTDALGI